LKKYTGQFNATRFGLTRSHHHTNKRQKQTVIYDAQYYFTTSMYLVAITTS